MYVGALFASCATNNEEISIDDLDHYASAYKDKFHWKVVAITT